MAAVHPEPSSRIESVLGRAAALAALVLAAGCMPEPTRCPEGGRFTSSPSQGEFCAYADGVVKCPEWLPYEYRADSGAVLCGSRDLAPDKLPRSACRAAGVKLCSSFQRSTALDAGGSSQDAEPAQDAEPLQDAELQQDAEPEQDGAPELDAEADAEAEQDAGLASDAGDEPDAATGADAASTEDAAAEADGAIAADDAATSVDAGLPLPYTADFTTGEAGWEATGIWKYGPAYDDTGWSNGNPHDHDFWSSTLTSPSIDLGSATDPVLELEIRYHGQWTGELMESGDRAATHFLISYNDGPWERIERYDNPSGDQREVGVHWGRWRCGPGAASNGGSRCEGRWLRAALPLPRRTPADRVRLQLETGWISDSYPYFDMLFAVRRVHIEENPRLYHAPGPEYVVSTYQPFVMGEEWVPTQKSGSAAVSFPVPPGATIRRFSLSVYIRADVENLGAPDARVWVRFPDGSRSESLLWWWDRDSYRETDYHFEFTAGPPIGSSAEGEFRLETEATSDVYAGSIHLYPWFAELLID